MAEANFTTNEAFFLILGILVGLSAAGFVFLIFIREKNKRIQSLGEQLGEESTKSSNLQIEFQSLQSRHNSMVEANTQRDQFIEKTMQEMTERFRNLSNTIYAEKTEEFKRNNKEQISNILNPLKENIDGFRKKVEDVHSKDSANMVELKTQIKSLSDQSLKIGEDARNLTNALKGDTKIQGQWGEIVLERYLQNAGLVENENYFVQESITTDEGFRRRSDVIVNLPDDTIVVIDSKVSLTDYERFSSTENEDERSLYENEHLKSIRSHIKGLDVKKYYQAFEDKGSLNFVMMFVPIESALSLAFEKDRELVSYAFNHNVILVNTSTLMLSLRLINNLWTREKQKRNAMEIARKGGALYDKFINFLDDFTMIGKRISDADASYQQGLNRLSEGKGNIIKRVDELREIGAKTEKKIPISFAKSLEEPEEDKDDSFNDIIHN